MTGSVKDSPAASSPSQSTDRVLSNSVEEKYDKKTFYTAKKS
jgi:hypothetical protein